MAEIFVSAEEYRLEIEHLAELRRAYDVKWTRLRELVGNVRYWEARVSSLTEMLETLKKRLPATWRNYVRIRDVELPKARERLTYWIREREAYIAEMHRELEEILRERERISRKKVMNQLVALHKRWKYKSPRGRYHDISIEGVASIVIPPDERKEDYELTLKTALEEYMFSQEGFERLSGIKDEVVGFESKPTKQPVRGVEIETLEWWHKAFENPQLKLDDFLEEAE